MKITIKSNEFNSEKLDALEKISINNTNSTYFNLNLMYEFLSEDIIGFLGLIKIIIS